MFPLKDNIPTDRFPVVTVALIVANAIPLVGALFLGWNVWMILVVYWLENGVVGFVNVLWDGLVHAWIQDTMVARSARHQGVGVAVVAVARDEARKAFRVIEGGA